MYNNPAISVIIIRMKILLVAINAKYIHSCPAVYDLNAYAGHPADIAEFTINDRYDDILNGIMSRNADFIGFSVYIWNAGLIHSIIKDIRRITDRPVLFAGGPEASNNYVNYIDDLDFIMTGEGELPFSMLVSALYSFPGYPQDVGHTISDDSQDVGHTISDTMQPACDLHNIMALLHDIPGLIINENGSITRTSDPSQFSLDSLPFVYDDLNSLSDRIIYYESSRGCPFRCTYCLSSIEKSVRFRSMDKVRHELQFFLDHKVPQVKFIDRTFNCSHEHAQSVWSYIKEHDNGITNFHFEIGADLLNNHELDLLSSMRQGLVQLEIGVQSTNQETLKAVNRAADLNRLIHAVTVLRQSGNINLHLDLIAGLPFEDMDSFISSFNTVYSLRAHQLQLGFLKVLPGTIMAEKVTEYAMAFSARPPYEIFRTKWISYYELCKLHKICDTLDTFYNSGQFSRTLPMLETHFASPYEMYEELTVYLESNGYLKNIPSHKDRYSVIRAFSESCSNISDSAIKQIGEYLKFDEALHFNSSRRMSDTIGFNFGGSPVRYRFDHSVKNPVNGECSYSLI